ncbi:MarR family winged helix-turn-helix transcriptional regulator [Pseudonocardia sp. TRM90224]|uniref:MarR family winged helix-turn-helix transcriptional regulator n=1 Tax=Pseudonocardia sp. TRM90224 TaxID=2812678 RepID=UPI001E368183|nr:MarR family transcriptional regulator [Pseudonocardia sp. TRM90224]
MPEQQQRDLGEMLFVLARTVIEAEEPLLRGHGVEMWDYAVLSRLADGPASTQAELAAAVRRDKTRLIPILDRLEVRKLLLRSPDPADRRNRIVSLTDAGHELLAACKASIRQMEDELLADLGPQERATFVAALTRLVD